MSTPSRATLFAARARRQRFRRLIIVLVTVVGGFVLIGVAWLVGWSNVLAVKDVDVAGVDDDLASDVLDAAAAPVGTPLVRADTAAVASRVGGLPEVSDVEVSRSWPSTLSIDVTPRTARAAVESDDRWYGVDESGVLFGEVPERPESLPVLEAPSSDDGREVRAAGVTVLAELPTDVLDRVESVEADSEADIRLVLNHDVTVELGSADDIGRKAEVLVALMEAQEEAPSAYDVSAPNKPAVTS